MDDLVSRVLAAIEETERLAQEACDGPWHVNDAGYVEAVYSTDGTCVIGGGRWGGEASVFDSSEDALHIVRNDPAAVLRCCAADRELVEKYREIDAESTRVIERGYAEPDEMVSERLAFEWVIKNRASAYGVSTEEGGDGCPDAAGGLRQDPGRPADCHARQGHQVSRRLGQEQPRSEALGVMMVTHLTQPGGTS